MPMKAAVEKIYNVCFNRQEISFQTKVYLLMAVLGVFTSITVLMISIV